MTENRPLVVVTVVTAVVLVLALGAAVLMRVERNRDHHSSAGGTTRTSGSPGSVRCSGGPCQQLATWSAGGTTAVLMADPYGRDGRLKFTGGTGTSIFETDVSGADVVLTSDSLRCVSGAAPACLVSGPYAESDTRPGHLGEVFARHGGYWSRVGYNYIYSSGGKLALGTGDDGLRVVAVQHSCGAGTSTTCAHPALYVQVYSVDGTSVGCTLTATRLELLPGKGTDVPPSYDLHSCPKTKSAG